MRADLCAPHVPFVYGGRVDRWTAIAPGAWRGTTWPCTGSAEAVDPVSGEAVTVICTHDCHHGGPAHVLPARAGRTAVHPTEVAR